MLSDFVSRTLIRTRCSGEDVAGIEAAALLTPEEGGRGSGNSLMASVFKTSIER